MMESNVARRVQNTSAPSHWKLWLSQLKGIFRLEIKRNLVQKRNLMEYLTLVSIPVILILIKAIRYFLGKGQTHSLAEMTSIYAYVFYYFYVRMVIFFFSLSLFTKLIKSEVADRTIHYYFLTPVKRSLIILGKYISGLSITFSFISISVFLSYILFYVPCGTAEMSKHFLQGPGFDLIGSFLLIIFLGCMAYGALFLLLGLTFKNPLVVGLFFLLWEVLSALLPARFKAFTIIFYLNSLMPITVIPQDSLALLADPASLGRCLFSLGFFVIILLAIAALMIKHKQVDYATE
ncbi:ABC transporter permease [candidate division CSSED10-310 bacterium]|uniref:ABC transporter permease n=1 Tax=candidate division CSSED10-310 bacterium TaxID=2855610 RepID=A0ABV6Z1Z2_UNCC1